MGKPEFDPSKPFQPSPDQASKPAFDPNQNYTPAETYTPSETALKSGTNAMAFGLKPFAAGVGGGAGMAKGTYDLSRNQGKGIGDSLKDAWNAGKQGFSEARQAENDDLKNSADQNPKSALAGGLLGSIASAPLTPIKGIGSAIGAGAAQGAGDALSSANNANDAIKDVSRGMLAGGITHGLIKGTGAIAPSIKSGAQKVTGKIGEALTGVPEQEIKTYLTKGDEIAKLAKSSGGDVGLAADQTRDKFMRQIQATKQNLGQQIGLALEKAPKDQSIDVSPMLDRLSSYRKSLDPVYHSGDISELDDFIKKIGTKISPDNKMSVQDLNLTKGFLQDIASQAYQKSGQVFNKSGKAELAAKGAAAEARKLLNGAVPEIANANNQLAQIHGVEDNINKSLIGSGKSEGALMAVGAGANNRNSAALSRLGKLTGQDPVGDAQVLASMRRFQNPSLTPADITGKSVLRTGGAALLGAHLGGPIGAAIGGAATSPMALKQGLNATKAVAPAFDSLGRLIQSPTGQAGLIKSGTGLLNGQQ